MIYPQLTELVKKTGSRYGLVIAAAKRARQISSGSEPLVKCKSNKSVTIAINEIMQDALDITETPAATPVCDVLEEVC